jgi:hypothetical protein
MILNHMQRAIQIAADLVMHAYAIRARFDEDRGVGVWILDHEVMIQLDARETAKGFSNWCSHGEIGNKMTVHDIHVQHLNTCLLHFANVLAQTNEISGENGWDNLEHVNYTFCMPLTRFTWRRAPPKFLQARSKLLPTGWLSRRQACWDVLMVTQGSAIGDRPILPGFSAGGCRFAQVSRRGAREVFPGDSRYSAQFVSRS